ncbi:MAG: sugar transferase [Candidatus Omnitrophica bacterium]|nr:sugar transferase [Candidatus Omnitrophota bacterium]MDD5352359.1 sugar transferase [Candidatus Omnitrophota bacterium]
MFRQKQLNLAAYTLYTITDAFFIILSFCLPYIIRWNILYTSEHTSRLFLPTPDQYFKLYIFWGIITILSLSQRRLYKTDRLLSMARETWFVIKAVLYSTLIAGLVVFFIKAIHISRLVFILNFISLCVLLSLWRAVKRITIRHFVLRGYNNFKILIIGTGNVTKELIAEIQNHPHLGWKIEGILDDNEEKGKLFYGYKVLGRISDFERIARQHFIDEILITIPEDKQMRMYLLGLAKELNISIKIIPDPSELSVETLSVDKIGNIPIIGYSIKELHGADLLEKRTIDIIASVFGIILLSPLFIILSIIIKLSDGGSVFYVSRRYGKKGEPFNLYKFRTMNINADSMLETLRNKNEKDGPIFKIKDDPRISKIGRFLRKYSLDELPQLWNVLKGEMSIVGPRPLPLGQVENHDFNQLKRLIIKPGITGLWQIEGRSDTTFQELINYDIKYINNWSLWLDIYIMFKTIPVVLIGRGAY